MEASRRPILIGFRTIRNCASKAGRIEVVYGEETCWIAVFPVGSGVPCTCSSSVGCPVARRTSFLSGQGTGPRRNSNNSI